MNYDLALCCVGDEEIGYGHIMRCYALAEAAVAMKVKVIVVVGGAPPLQWPCAVVGAPGQDGEFPYRTAGVLVLDYPSRYLSVKNVQERWCFMDAGPDDDILKALEGAHGLIYPHFGAQPIPGFPTLAGERWIPLRNMWRHMDAPLDANGVLLYRVSKNVEKGEKSVSGSVIHLLGDGGWESSYEALAQVSRVVCPPCTLAYEAMACGRVVNIVCPPDHPSFPIGEAMVASGYATWWLADSLQPGKRLDTRGAQRILEALL